MDNMELIIYSKQSEFCHQAKKKSCCIFQHNILDFIHIYGAEQAVLSTNKTIDLMK